LKNIIKKGEYQMSNKLTVTKRKMASLGLKKTVSGDYDYIDPSDKNKSEYKPVKKEPR
jgi:hypothetical protein